MLGKLQLRERGCCRAGILSCSACRGAALAKVRGIAPPCLTYGHAECRIEQSAKGKSKGNDCGWQVKPVQDNSFKRKVLLCSAVCAIALTVFVACLGAPGGYVAHLHVPDTAGAAATTGLMIVAGPLFVLWGASMYMRCSDMVVRRYLVLIVSLLVLWLLAVLVKYASVSDVVGQMCWYLYYVPMVFIPLFCFLAGLRSAGVDGLRVGVFAGRIALVVSSILVLFVLTNNFHMLAFRFDVANARWSAEYTYGPVYWAVLVWVFLLLAMFLLILFVAARKQLRAAFLPFVVLVVLGLVYSALCITRIDAVFRGNVSLTYAIFFALALELCLDLGLFPSFFRYREAFTKLPFDAKIISLKGNQEFATACAAPLKESELQALARAEDLSSGMVSFKVESEPNKIYKAYRLNGGAVLLTEDRTDINARIRLLAERSALLDRENEILKQDIAVKSRLCQQEHERALVENVSASLQSAAESIRRLLDDIPDVCDSDASADRRRHLMLVKLLVAYCKRKGSFVLSEKEDIDFDQERLRLAISETVADVRSAGIDCGSLIEVACPIPVASLSILYDCFYDVVVMAFECTDPVLMFFITERDGKRIELRVKMECEDDIDFGLTDAVRSLRATLDGRDVAYRLTGGVGELHFVAIVSKKVGVSPASAPAQGGDAS